MFPTTRPSLIERMRRDDTADRAPALNALAAAYWTPIYVYLRTTWKVDREDAEDLTQEFLGRVLGDETLARYDASKARLRTYLRLCVDRFVLNERKAARRLKRGGGARSVSIDLAHVDAELSTRAAVEHRDPDELFQREWARSVFTTALEELRRRYDARGKTVRFALFMRHDVEGDAPDRPSYAQLAAEHAISVTQVTNDLAAARADFRRIILEVLQRITTSDEELRLEVRALLGIELS